MEAYFINPVKRILKRRRKATVKTEAKEIKVMAKRRKSSKKGEMPAALKKYWAAKRAGKSVAKKSHRNAPKVHKTAPHKRRRHVVKAHRVGGYRRPKTGSQYLSNPMRAFGNTGSAVVGGLVAVGVLFGSLFAVGYINGFKNKVPMLASGWGSLAAKLAIGLGIGMAANEMSKRNWLSGKNAAIVAAAGFAPLGLDLLGRVAPGIASQISLADDEEVAAEMGAEMGMTPGNRLSDYTIDAEMGAEMGESESSSY